MEGELARREGNGPLAGIRVLELTHYAVGPYAGFLLGVLGAEIVKIENPAGGDPLRGWGADEGHDSPSTFFRSCNAGKASVAIDIKHPSGADAVRALLPNFDVFITNLNYDTLASCGLSGTDCLGVSPGLVYVGITGFGSSGPLAGRPGFDSIAQAVTGMMSVYLSSGSVPDDIPAIADLSGGLTAAAGAMAGLITRLRTGSGLVVETSLLESMTAILSGSQMIAASPTDGARSRLANSQMFQLKAADDRYVAIHLSTSTRHWERLMVALGAEDIATDPRFATYSARVEHFAELHAALSGRFTSEPSETWELVLDGAGVPFATVVALDEAIHQPQVLHQQLFFESDTPSRPVYRGPWRMAGGRPMVSGELAPFGADSVRVLREALPKAQVDQLVADGVVRSS